MIDMGYCAWCQRWFQRAPFVFVAAPAELPARRTDGICLHCCAKMRETISSAQCQPEERGHVMSTPGGGTAVKGNGGRPVCGDTDCTD